MKTLATRGCDFRLPGRFSSRHSERSQRSEESLFFWFFPGAPHGDSPCGWVMEFQGVSLRFSRWISHSNSSFLAGVRLSRLTPSLRRGRRESAVFNRRLSVATVNSAKLSVATERQLKTRNQSPAGLAAGSGLNDVALSAQAEACVAIRDAARPITDVQHRFSAPIMRVTGAR